MDRDWNRFEVHARNVAVRGNFSEGSERKEESCRESFHLLREYRHNHTLNVARNVNVKGCPGEISDGNEQYIIGNWKKNHSCYKVAKNLAELCSSVPPLIKNATLSDSKFSYIALCLESLFLIRKKIPFLFKKCDPMG